MASTLKCLGQLEISGSTTDEQVVYTNSSGGDAVVSLIMLTYYPGITSGSFGIHHVQNGESVGSTNKIKKSKQQVALRGLM